MSLGDFVSGKVKAALPSDILGGAVEDFSRGGLDSIFKTGKFDKNVLNSLGTAIAGNFDIGGLFGSSNKQTWQSANYADDFIEYAPKSKFLFKIAFEFDTAYQQYFNPAKEFSFLVKSIDRPRVTFEYDDINMYNYRSKALKKMSYEPISIVFHDDIKNKVLAFYELYRRAMSPAARTAPDAYVPGFISELGMEFGDGNIIKSEAGSSGFYGAGTGGFATINPITNIIRKIKIYQIFAHGSAYNVYTLYNPKIESMELDGLDYESSEGSTLTTSFSFDYMNLDTYVSAQKNNKDVAPKFGAVDILDEDRNAGKKGAPHIPDSQYSPQSTSGLGDIALNLPSVDQEEESLLGGIGSSLLKGATSALSGAAQNTIKKAIGKSGLNPRIAGALGNNIGGIASAKNISAVGSKISGLIGKK